MQNHHPILSCFLVTFLSISIVSAVDSTLDQELGSESSLGPNGKPYKSRLIRRKSIESGQSYPDRGPTGTQDQTQTNPSSLTTIDATSKTHEKINHSKHSPAFNATHWNQTSAIFLPSNEQTYQVPSSAEQDQLSKRRFVPDESNYSPSKPVVIRRKFKRNLDPVIRLDATVPVDHARRSLGKSVRFEKRSPDSTRSVFRAKRNFGGSGQSMSLPMFTGGTFEDFDGLFGDSGAGMMTNQVQGGEADRSVPANVGLSRRNMNSNPLSSRHNGQTHGDQSAMTSSSGDTGDSVDQGSVGQQQALQGPQNSIAPAENSPSQFEEDPTDFSDEVNSEINRINAQPPSFNGQQVQGLGDTSDSAPYPTSSPSQPALSTSSPGTGQDSKSHHKGPHSKNTGVGLSNPNLSPNQQNPPTGSSSQTGSTTQPWMSPNSSNDNEAGTQSWGAKRVPNGITR